MIALLLAAGLAAGPPALLEARRPAGSCDYWMAKPVSRLLPRDAMSRLPSLRLGDQPPADMHLLVLRRDAKGCSTPVIVRYDVQGDGRFATGERSPPN